MEDFEKQVVFITISFLIGLALVLTGVTDWIHDNIKQIAQPLFEGYNEEKAPMVAESLAYGVGLAIASIIMFSPMSSASTSWFFKIGYDLVLGKHAGTNIFIIDPVLNYVMAILCLTLLVYGLYNQYTWSVKLIQPGTKGTEDEIARLI